MQIPADSDPAVLGMTRCESLPLVLLCALGYSFVCRVHEFVHQRLYRMDLPDLPD